MTPSVKKTWARRACTPVVPYRNRRQKKVSVPGAVALHAATGTVDLLCDFHPDSYVRGEQAAAFLHRVLAEYPGRPIDLVWDNLSAHKSPIVREVTDAHPRLRPHYLPPYAPDLNPVEGAWQHLKHVELRNVVCLDLEELHLELHLAIGRLRQKPRLIQSFFEGAGLKLEKLSSLRYAL